jgi:hypothetical protein
MDGPRKVSSFMLEFEEHLEGKLRQIRKYFRNRLITMKFHIDVGGGLIDTESFYWFRKFLIIPAPH